MWVLKITVPHIESNLFAWSLDLLCCTTYTYRDKIFCRMTREIYCVTISIICMPTWHGAKVKWITKENSLVFWCMLISTQSCLTRKINYWIRNTYCSTFVVCKEMRKYESNLIFHLLTQSIKGRRICKVIILMCVWRERVNK